MLTARDLKPFKYTPGVAQTPAPPPLWFRQGVRIFIDDDHVTWIDRVGPYIRFDIDAAGGEALRVGPYIRLEELDI